MHHHVSYPWWATALPLRVAMPPATSTALVKQVRAIVAQADNNLPSSMCAPSHSRLGKPSIKSGSCRAFRAFFACHLALILACIGLYGLLSYEVARRTRELGDSMALGAQRRELMRLVVRRGLLLALAGTVIGHRRWPMRRLHASCPRCFITCALTILQRLGAFASSLCWCR